MGPTRKSIVCDSWRSLCRSFWSRGRSRRPRSRSLSMKGDLVRSVRSVIVDSVHGRSSGLADTPHRSRTTSPLAWPISHCKARLLSAVRLWGDRPAGLQNRVWIRIQELTVERVRGGATPLLDASEVAAAQLQCQTLGATTCVHNLVSHVI